MNLLDLQGLTIENNGGASTGSEASLLLCGDSSLSVTTCD